MDRFTYEWWPQILQNHGLPRMKYKQMQLLIGLGEDWSDFQIAEDSQRAAVFGGDRGYKRESLAAQYHLLANLLGLKPPTTRRTKMRKGENRRLLAAWCKENLDLLYRVSMHITPDEDCEPDCYLEACRQMQ